MATILPDLEGWAIFAKVAEMGSFAKAASELNLSQATVSKAISRLETRLNVMLVQRTSRAISLTEAGYAALERAIAILENGHAIEEEISEQATSLRGRIRISLPISFGVKYVAPILTDFLMQHQDVEIDADYSDKQIDLIEDKIDLSLRIANMVDSSLIIRSLCSVRILLVGSPSYFANHGKLEHPRDLANHKTFKYAYNFGKKGWSFVHKEHGEFTQITKAQMQANNAEALTPALLAGLGVALQPEFLVWDELQNGSLQTALDDWHIKPLMLHIVTPPGRKRPHRVQALIDHIAQALTKQPWVHAKA
ncbi:LysR family transcriptional regulator [Bartonella sp. HY406]|uniref:LysR family transcriptional regulator n=1 Tax=Bartonella sp. HY406 TaxID=2979331 RepID=UPI0021C88138|nr:LysR family transcriptional regulator [Bartonella sp. HY406]UXN03313.1 LysR family transcriptional regulator [Bartonella sp. HY406]